MHMNKMDHGSRQGATVGYYKVWTTGFVGLTPPEGAHVGPEPRREAPASSADAMVDRSLDRIMQWIFPFSRATHDAVRIQAFAKADAIKAAIPRAVIKFSPLEQLDTYAIRVDAD